MESVLLDIKFAFRRFARQPLVTAVIILTLALGIGATTAIFSVVNGVILQALPFDDADRFVTIKQSQPIAEKEDIKVSAQEIKAYRENTNTLENVSEYHNMTFTMLGRGEPLRLRTGVVSSNYFDLLGVEPLLGRLFQPDEDKTGAEPLVVLSYEFWLSEFGGDNNVIGSSIEMNNRSHKIIGVLPKFSQFPNVDDIYIATPSCPWRSSERFLNNRTYRLMSSYAKVKEGFSIEQANSEINSIGQQFESNFPEAYPKENGFAAHALSLKDELVKDTKSHLLILLGTTILVLLISSANVTNLTLSQIAKRQRELAVRSSVGASRGRIAQQLLTESILLGLIGGMLGLLLAFLGSDLLNGFAEHFTNRSSEIKLDHNVMFFALGISLLSGIVSGLVPAFTKQNLVTSLKEGGKSTSSSKNQKLKNLLLVAQFTLSLTLIVAAGLTIKSLHNLESVKSGYDPKGVEVVQLDLNWSIYKTPQEQWRVSKQILDKVNQLPYVNSAGVSMTYPMDSIALNRLEIREAIQFDDRDFNPDDVPPMAYQRPVSHGYFETIKANILQGRSFTHRDDELSTNVALINRSMAEQYWPNESAVNHKISLDKGNTWLTIVGIVDDIKEHGLSKKSGIKVYRPMAQLPTSHIAILGKVGNNGSDFIKDIRSIVLDLDKKQPLSKKESLQDALDASLSLQRFITQLLTVFAAIAVFITISGISGVMAYNINLRTREIGVRMAIGADKKAIMLMIMKFGFGLAAIGLSVGLICAVIVAKGMGQLLFNVEYLDLTIYSIAIFGLLFITMIACALPAYRASAIPTVSALRS